MVKIGLAFDLIKFECIQDRPLDCIAELDSEGTVQAVANALQAGGHEVFLLEADDSFADKLRCTNPDIVFNIAEGLHGESRESRVPAICDFYGIPYTGSGVLTLSLCLDKARTNEVLRSYGLLVPPFQVMRTRDDALLLADEFPLIAKLLCEGSSMGLSRQSVVEDETALRNQVEFLFTAYHEPVLVQKFILGREFNVGILGNRNPTPLPITEIIFTDPHGIVMFYPDEEIIPMIKQIRGEQYVHDFISQVIPKKSVCPAQVSSALAERINRAALSAFKAVECRDWCRVDFRLDADDRLYILEINPIAGIAPGYWLPKSAEVVGMDYESFINRILDIAWERIYA
jgi:D-alanine-D-alanine ligase